MILTPTVFVLGAGASHDYGLPLGDKLIKDVYGHSSGGETGKALLSAILQRGAEHLPEPQSQHPSVWIDQFRQELQIAGRYSIDAFIESRADDYDLIGRCAIAQQLLKYDYDGAPHQAPDDKDWYRYLLSNILGSTPDQFVANQLRIITFNFDRSFERALFSALESNYKDAERRLGLYEHIPILHIHGRLGGANWKPSRDRDPFLSRIALHTVSPHDIRRSADHIHIVHHKLDEDVLRRAAEWLLWSKRICFLGFSFHPLNLIKLQIPSSLRNKTIWATRYGIPDGPFSNIYRAVTHDGVAANFLTPTQDIMSLLTSTDIIHE
jgi:hypothetical protein